MPTVLVGTEFGCRVFCKAEERTPELYGRKVGPFELEMDGACLAVVDDNQVWRRSTHGAWSEVATVDIELQSIMSCGGTTFCGGMNEAAIIRIPRSGRPERLRGFEDVAGRSEWFAGGPPLGVRSLSKTSDKRVLIAAVHVGGMPRSEDGGETWAPTIPIMFDVHEVSAHSSLPDIIVAAAAVGLCVSSDRGRTWHVLAEGLDATSSLAVAVLDHEVLFSVQKGPFAKHSQLWRWQLASKEIEVVRDGLPEWLEGRVDTNQIAAGCGRFAVVDCGGNLWLSETGSSGWKRIAEGLPYALGVEIF